jgi:hypothetical protein
MEQALQVANGLWNGGHFYAAVLLFMPVQIAYVMLHNITIWIAACCANSMMKGTK